MEYDELPTYERIRTKVLKRRAKPKYEKPCMETHKRSFPTEKAALFHRSRLVKEGQAEYLRVYKCLLCKFWHLTSQRSRNGKAR